MREYWHEFFYVGTNLPVLDDKTSRLIKFCAKYFELCDHKKTVAIFVSQQFFSFFALLVLIVVLQRLRHFFFVSTMLARNSSALTTVLENAICNYREQLIHVDVTSFLFSSIIHDSSSKFPMWHILILSRHKLSFFRLLWVLFFRIMVTTFPPYLGYYSPKRWIKWWENESPFFVIV